MLSLVYCRTTSFSAWKTALKYLCGLSHKHVRGFCLVSAGGAFYSFTSVQTINAVVRTTSGCRITYNCESYFNIRQQLCSDALSESASSEDHSNSMNEQETSKVDKPTLIVSAKVASVSKTEHYFCPKCCASFLSQAHLDRHMKQLHTESLYKCSQCKSTFHSHDHFKKHLKRHQGIFDCNVCKISLSSAEKLLNHMQSIHMSTEESTHATFTCPHCSREFYVKSALDKHVQTTHVNPNAHSVLCCQCAQGFTTLGKLFRHLRVHKKNGTLICCEECSCGFKSTKQFKYLTTLDAASSEISVSDNELTLVDDVSDDEGPGKWMCRICNRPFSSEQNFDEHNEKHHGDGLPTCDVCGAVFETRDKLRRHVRLPHSFVCDTCGEKFTKRRRLQQHLNDTGHVLKCAQCGVQYPNIYSLRRHLTQHSGRLSCSQCDKAFRTPADLRAHMRMHSGEKPFNCAACNLAFLSRPSYIRHLLAVHTAPKSEETTPKSGATFSNSEVMTHKLAKTEPTLGSGDTTPKAINHVSDCIEIKHSDRDADPVPVEASATETIENTHQALPDGASSAVLARSIEQDSEFTFFCNQCDEGFSSKSILLHHIITLHSQMPSVEDSMKNEQFSFSCAECMSKFPSQFSLQLHCVRDHKLAVKDAVQPALE